MKSIKVKHIVIKTIWRYQSRFSQHTSIAFSPVCPAACTSPSLDLFGGEWRVLGEEGDERGSTILAEGGTPKGKAAAARENLVLASLSCEWFTWGMKAGERGCGRGGATRTKL